MKESDLRRSLRVLVAALVTLTGCERVFFPFPPLSPRIELLPQRLSEAGLYADASLTTPAPDARPYTPRFEFWSDGATKRRWIRLPANASIDTTDMDDWEFPVGAELWKEFSHDGVRVETRLLLRETTQSDGWVAVSYVWNVEQTEAVVQPSGVENALGTPHDVPEARACMTCHGGRRHRVLGFSAIQLSAPSASGSDLTLDRLAREGLISSAPSAPLKIPGNQTEVAALGYLHTNCGSCHNEKRPADAKYLAPPAGLDLWLQADALRELSATPTLRTAIPKYIRPGRPELSSLFKHVASPDWPWQEMPPIAVEVEDRRGVDTLYRWIEAMGPE